MSSLHKHKSCSKCCSCKHCITVLCVRIKKASRHSAHALRAPFPPKKTNLKEDICIFKRKLPSAHYEDMSSTCILVNIISLFLSFTPICQPWLIWSVRVFDIEIDDNKVFCPSDYFHRQCSSAPDVSRIVTASIL